MHYLLPITGPLMVGGGGGLCCMSILRKYDASCHLIPMSNVTCRNQEMAYRCHVTYFNIGYII